MDVPTREPDAERAHADALHVRVKELERRMLEAEDRLELLQIVASYGPAVDSGSPAGTAQLWTENGVYDTYPHVLTGRAAIEQMVTGDLHQQIIDGGAAHLLGLPHITISGDTAVVTNYSQLVLRDPDTDGFRVWRTGVNRWEFVRTADGWRATFRANRQLDGTSGARDLLASAIEPPGRREPGGEGMS